MVGRSEEISEERRSRGLEGRDLELRILFCSYHICSYIFDRYPIISISVFEIIFWLLLYSYTLVSCKIWLCGMNFTFTFAMGWRT